MNIATIGIDLAKNVFQLHGVNGQGKAVLPFRTTGADIQRIGISCPMGRP
jgi:hypothetical protein